MKNNDDVERRYYKGKKFVIYPSKNKIMFWTLEVISSDNSVTYIDGINSYSTVNEIIMEHMK